MISEARLPLCASLRVAKKKVLLRASIRGELRITAVAKSKRSEAVKQAQKNKKNKKRSDPVVQLAEEGNQKLAHLCSACLEFVLSCISYVI